MSSLAIDATNIGKTYPFFELSGVDLRLEPGQIMGFVGPNGAGKSTTIRILMGMIQAERGEVRVLGHTIPADQAAAKRNIGFVSEDMRLYAGQTLAWHLGFVAKLFPEWDQAYASELLRRFNLHPSQRIKALSHGERVKATLLLVLARRPRLLLLDEPTTGLDPVARHEVLTELMAVMQDERRAILFSSHNTQDVELISDQITFLDRGRIVDSRDKESYLDRWRRLHLEIAAEAPLPQLPGVIEVTRAGRIAVVTTQAFTPDLAAAYSALGATVREVQRLTLEEIFVATVMHTRGERSK